LGKLDGKIVLVTGSGRGFGRSMAVAYGQEGAIVVSVARTIAELEQTEELISSKGGEVLTLQVDLSSEVEILKLKKIILGEYSGIDILVNNAALSPWKTIEDTTLEEWDKTVAVNMRAPFLLCKAFMNSMQSRGGGSIINVSSKSAEMGFVGESAYCPSKYGLEGLTQCLALELKPRNIAVNSLNVSAPNGMSLKPTGLTLEELKTVTQEVVDRYADVESMVRVFGDAWVFLALQDGDGVTGQRFITSKLSKELNENGWASVVENYSNKLSCVLYEPYKFPDKVRYQTPNGGWKELIFR
jgi:NAD(P)-dependent dehydrogenase (short-subunit alcohol dehydrogenase family)